MLIELGPRVVQRLEKGFEEEESSIVLIVEQCDHFGDDHADGILFLESIRQPEGCIKLSSCVVTVVLCFCCVGLVRSWMFEAAISK